MERGRAYVTVVRRSIGWNGNTHGGQATVIATEREALQLAFPAVEEMRRDGAQSPIRAVRVRYAEGARTIFQANYYETEQRLSEAETYAARVHDWHKLPDLFNDDSREHFRQSLPLASYAWQAAWGEAPRECPGCGTGLASRTYAPFPPGVVLQSRRGVGTHTVRSQASAPRTARVSQ